MKMLRIDSDSMGIRWAKLEGGQRREEEWWIKKENRSGKCMKNSGKIDLGKQTKSQ